MVASFQLKPSNSFLDKDVVYNTTSIAYVLCMLQRYNELVDVYLRDRAALENKCQKVDIDWIRRIANAVYGCTY